MAGTDDDDYVNPRFFDGGGLRFPDGRIIAYEDLAKIDVDRRSAITGIHTLISVLSQALDVMLSDEAPPEQIEKVLSMLRKILAASGSITSESRAWFFFTLAIENAATGLDSRGASVDPENRSVIAAAVLAANGYADIAARIDESDVKRLIGIWRGEEKYKGGKWAAVLAYGKRVLPLISKNAASLSRDYREWKSTLPQEPQLIFALRLKKA